MCPIPEMLSHSFCVNDSAAPNVYVRVLSQVLFHPDAMDKPVSCGLFYDKTLWCGCGTYLIGLDPKDLLMKHYKPIVKEAEVAMMAGSGDHVWVGFQDSSAVVVCNVFRTSQLETLDCQ